MSQSYCISPCDADPSFALEAQPSFAPGLLSVGMLIPSSALSQDYCSEAHLTRRLNDLGCKNVIKVG